VRIGYIGFHLDIAPFEYIVERKVEKLTATSIEWWHPIALFFDFIWAILLGWKTFFVTGWS